MDTGGCIVEVLRAVTLRKYMRREVAAAYGHDAVLLDKTVGSLGVYLAG